MCVTCSQGLKTDLEILLFQTFLSLSYQDKWCHPKQFCNEMLKFIELLNRAHFKAKEAPLEIDNDGNAQLQLNRDNQESSRQENICKMPPQPLETNTTNAAVDYPLGQTADVVESKD